MQLLPSIWIANLGTYEATVETIESLLAILKSNATDADFTDIAVRDQYISDTAYMKQFFERAEKLVRDSQ